MASIAIGTDQISGLHYIDGERVDSAGRFEVFSPIDTRVLGDIALAGPAEVDRAVAAAARAFPAWAALGAEGRLPYLQRFTEEIGKRAELFCQAEANDAGVLLSRMQHGIVPRAMLNITWFAEAALTLQDKVIESTQATHLVRHDPAGVCAIITPWNSPLTLTSWKLAPALAAGCTAVIKPSEFTSASMIELAAIATQAGVPDGVINVVTGFGPEVGEPLVSHPAVAHIGFTGGEVAGQKIYEAAARGMKTVTLELGGKSPNIVFDDADLDQAVKGIVSGIFAATGQTCQAGSRLLVQDNIHDEVVRRLIDFIKDAKIGDPADLSTQIGPVATKPQFDKILAYIEIAKEEGAELAFGGEARPDIGSGQFIEPTIFTNVDNKMRVAQEEIFGPVLSVIRFHDDEQAVRIGNDIAYGLAAGVWTQSLSRTMYVTERLKAGTIYVNNYRATSFTSPFGGFKRSGIGRESGPEAIKDYLDTKTVWLSSDLDVPNPFIRR